MPFSPVRFGARLDEQTSEKSNPYQHVVYSPIQQSVVQVSKNIRSITSLNSNKKNTNLTRSI